MSKSISGGVEIINTLSTKNDGDYPLVMAESVGMKDGANAEDVIKNKLNTNQGTENNGKFMKVGADGNLKPEIVPIPDVSAQINTHDKSPTSHNDIRDSVNTLKNDKLDKNQGVNNTGKIITVGDDGNVVTRFPNNVTYNPDTKNLEYGSNDSLPLIDGVKLDTSLTKGGFAADAKITGDKINKIESEATTLKEQIAQNKTGIEALKQGKADAIVETASGKTIITRDSSSAPIKTLSGKGKIIITGKNILDTEKNGQFIPFAANADTLFTLITNGVKSAGGNIRFVGEDGENVWFAINSGETEKKGKINKNVKGFYNELAPKEGLKYCFSVGENDKYEEYVEQVITAPVSAEQIKTIHTNYPITVLTSENEITVEYVADTEKYIGKRMKEENQTLQKQITDLQNALISQKISGGV